MRVDRHVVQLEVSHRDRRLTFLAPFDRPVVLDAEKRHRSVRRQAALARLCGALARRRTFRLLMSAIDAHIDLLPYQLEPAIAVVVAGARRALIADEVGLGKTIQAGLTLAEIARRRPGFRGLVMAPGAVVEQWRDELRSRFGLTTTVADACGLASVEHVGPTGRDPWARDGLWIASLDFLKQRHVLEALPAEPWDVVVIDEAHEACGDSHRHDAADSLLRRARHAVLLTATPHSGDDHRFARLMSLGALPGESRPVFFRRTRREVSPGTTRRVRWHRVRPHALEAETFDTLAAFEHAVFASARAKRDKAILLLSIFRKRALSTMAALEVSLARRLAWLEEPQRLPDWYQPRFAFEYDADDIDQAEQDTLLAEIDLPAHQERIWLKRLRTLATRASRVESKLERLASMVARAREPVVIFTEFRHSLDAVRRRLSGLRRVTTLYGGLTASEHRAALTRFLTGEADALIATDVAGQGLNLQNRARWVVSLEVPWNPVRLEQRLGRVDRIGQRRPSHLTVLLVRHALESPLLRNVDRRVVSAQRTLGTDVLNDFTLPSAGVARAALADPSPDASREASWRQETLSDSTWRRSAMAMTRTLRARRVLASRWRQSATGPRAASASLRRRVMGLHAQNAVVISVPIVDGTGEVVEEILLGLGVDDLPALDTLAREVLRTHAKRLQARLHRLQRSLDRWTSAVERSEAALGRHLHAMNFPEQVQAALFDRRSLLRFEARRREASEITRATEAEVAALNGRRHLSPGMPSIELVLRLPGL